MEQQAIQPQPPVEIPPNPTKPWLKIALFATLGLILISGLLFAGIKIGRKQSQMIIYPSPTPLEETLSTPIPTITSAATYIPTRIITPSPESTAGWKSYINQSYGFSIKYPSYLIPKEGDVLGETRVVLFVYELEPTKIEFTIEKNFHGGWMGKKEKEKKIIVDGVVGNISLWLNCDTNIAEDWDKCIKQLTLENYDSAILRGYFEKGNDKWYVVYKEWKRGEKNVEEEIQKLDEILSTFKFLD